MLTKFQLSGLSCQACQKLTQGRIGKIAGVSKVNVDIGTGLAEIEADRVIDKEEVAVALAGTPYQIV